MTHEHASVKVSQGTIVACRVLAKITLSSSRRGLLLLVAHKPPSGEFSSQQEASEGRFRDTVQLEDQTTVGFGTGLFAFVFFRLNDLFSIFLPDFPMAAFGLRCKNKLKKYEKQQTSCTDSHVLTVLFALWDTVPHGPRQQNESWQGGVEMHGLEGGGTYFPDVALHTERWRS